ncbi:MAG: 6-carboxytetrahydropterin synthase QueD [Phycisphaeraceae bacterium]|nr:6-carboxytetrahydropterin synthase QueD [Phycisphaeraceae bacterium]
MQITLTKTFTFDSAHWLPTFPEGHKCRRMHGHSFHVDVLVAGDVNPEAGYLIDYGDIKRVVGPIIDSLDHRVLNEIEGLENPTAEMLCVWLYERIKPQLPLLDRIRVRETCTSEAEYTGPAA